MRVYTSRIGCGYDKVVDITVKSGLKAFAPTWDMVMGYKKGKLSEDKYTQLYVAHMRKSYIRNRALWNEILGRKRVVFVCYCKAGEFCHRVLLARIFEILGAEYGGEI